MPPDIAQRGGVTIQGDGIGIILLHGLFKQLKCLVMPPDIAQRGGVTIQGDGIVRIGIESFFKKVKFDLVIMHFFGNATQGHGKSC